MILALKQYEIEAYREDGLTGVWVDGAKIAAFGVRVKRWVTMHGIGVNVKKGSLENFGRIKPCGIDREVTCLEDCAGDASITMEGFGKVFCEAFEQVFNIDIDKSV